MIDSWGQECSADTSLLMDSHSDSLLITHQRFPQESKHSVLEDHLVLLHALLDFASDETILRKDVGALLNHTAEFVRKHKSGPRRANYVSALESCSDIVLPCAVKGKNDMEPGDHDEYVFVPRQKGVPCEQSATFKTVEKAAGVTAMVIGGAPLLCVCSLIHSQQHSHFLRLLLAQQRAPQALC